MRTLFTGIAPDSLEALLASYGADIIVTPLIEIVPIEDDTALRQTCARLSDYDYLLFTSRHAVAAVVQCTALLAQFTGRFVAIGGSTAAALRSAGFPEAAQPEEDNSYGVISWFEKQTRGRVLIPRSNLALDIIPEGLRGLGFEVDAVTAYVNRMPSSPRKVDLGRIDRIVFTSPSTIDHFIRLYGVLPTDKEYITRGPVTEQHLQTIINQQSL